MTAAMASTAPMTSVHIQTPMPWRAPSKRAMRPAT
jgi:hypothetical protein